MRALSILVMPDWLVSATHALGGALSPATPTTSMAVRPLLAGRDGLHPLVTTDVARHAARRWLATSGMTYAAGPAIAAGVMVEAQGGTGFLAALTVHTTLLERSERSGTLEHVVVAASGLVVARLRTRLVSETEMGWADLSVSGGSAFARPPERAVAGPASADAVPGIA